jgi:glucokinase
MTQTLALGIDIGGTNTSFGIVNRRGEILNRGRLRTQDYPSLPSFLQALKKMIAPALEEVGHENIVGCGVGAPNGNFYTGEIAFAPNLPWEGVIPLAKLISETFQLRVQLTNDANAAAMGEMMYGAAKGLKDFILVTLGTGVGSGFVSNGQMIYGADGFAGELGHVISVRNGRLCGCGRHGCLEQYTSATGIVKTAELWLAERDDETMLRAHAGNVSARLINQAADEGDQFALEIFDYTAKILGQTLADAIAITSPQAIIFFGGLAKAGDLLFVPAHRYMEANLLRVFKNKVQFMLSALPDADAAILGASALIW